MAIKLSEEIKELFQDKNALKVLATTDEKGDPHVAFKNSFHINEEGQLIYLEIIETSETNRNLVSSIWFNRKVAVNILCANKKSYQIKGKPIKAIISGAIFEKYYKEVRSKFEDSDLSTVWIIEPEEIREETFKVRREKEEKEHLLLIHLDRLVKR